jgi:hypothetical protein
MKLKVLALFMRILGKMYLLILVKSKVTVLRFYEGQRVSFTIADGKKGPQATGITVIAQN